jgi:hypothetical protein
VGSDAPALSGDKGEVLVTAEPDHPGLVFVDERLRIDPK